MAKGTLEMMAEDLTTPERVLLFWLAGEECRQLVELM